MSGELASLAAGNPAIAEQLLRFQRQRWEQELQQLLFDFGRGRGESGEQFDRDVAFGYLLGLQADEHGIETSDQTVSQFINRVTRQSPLWTPEMYRLVLERIGIGDERLYDALRGELKCQQAFQLLRPATYTTPDEFWDFYKRLTVKQSLDFTAIPVEAFVGEVGKPGDLTAFFETYQDQFPNQNEPGQPGFVQRPKVRLGYVSVAQRAIESRLPEPTEAELRAYYEENKQLFPSNQLPDELLKPDDVPNPPPPVRDSPPAGEGSPEPEKKDEPRAGEPKPSEDADSTNGDEPGAETSRKDDTGASQPSISDDVPAASNDDSGNAGESTAADSGSDEADPKGGDEPPPKADSSADSDEPTSESSADAPSDEDGAKPKAGSTSKDRVEFKPFEEVREQVRENLLRDRATEEIDALVEKTYELMTELGVKYQGSDLDAPDALTLRDLGRELKAFAERNGVDYTTTPLLTAHELTESRDYSIGDALTMRGGEQVVSRVFSGDVSESLVSPIEARSGVGDVRYVVWKLAGVPAHVPMLAVKEVRGGTSLADLAEELGFNETDRRKLFPRAGEIDTIARYFAAQLGGDVSVGASVDVGQFRLTAVTVSDGLPTELQLHEPGIREQVEKAWKIVEARPKARDRAEELAEQAEKKRGTALAVLFEDETVTGAEDGQKLEFLVSPEFSWLTRSSVPGQGFESSGPARLSSIPGIDGAGEDFMREVFDRLENGHAGAVPNFDRTVYYVVRVKERNPLHPVDSDVQLSEFLAAVRDENTGSGTYARLATREQLEVIDGWARSLEGRYELRLNVPRR